MSKDKRIYEPGELDKTRTNLGELSREEAKKMREKLGGEIGYEKTDPTVDQKYKRLRDQLPGDELVDSKPTSSAFLKGGKSKAKVKKKKLPFQPQGMKRWERFRTNLHLSSIEYGFKSFSQALMSLFSRGDYEKDLVQREYILGADHNFTRGIENLVLAVRGLSSRSNKKVLQGLRRFPLYYNIVKTLREWPVETLHEILITLQRSPGKQSFTDLYELAQVCLKTSFLLSTLSMTGHILPALAKTMELGKTYTTQKAPLERLKRYYVIAREEAPHLFDRLKQKLFPVLVKFLSSKFISEEDFYKDYYNEILRFLNIDQKNLLQPEKSSAALTMGEEEGKKKKNEPSELMDYFPDFTLHPLSQKGVEILDVLFPGARWAEMEKQPDYLAYYLPFLDFPRGTELLGPYDPLQPVLALVAVLQNLFYGFQNFRWGTCDGYTTHGSLQQEFEKLVSSWHFFIEEVLGKHYLPLIQELCRQVERDGSIGSDARKKIGKILFLKRSFFLPNLIIPLVDSFRNFPIGHPPLQDLVKRMLSLLSKVAIDVEQRMLQSKGDLSPSKEGALLNPNQKWKFEIPSPVSNRLSVVLQKVNRVTTEEIGGVEGRTNRKLLFYTICVLNYLDDLISQQGSPLYTRGETPLFRQVSETDPRPVYTAPQRDSLKVLEKNNEHIMSTGKILLMDENPRDYYDSFLFEDEINRRMQDYKEEKTSFLMGVLQVKFTPSMNWASVRARILEILTDIHPGAEIHTWLDDHTLAWISLNPPQREGILLRQILNKGAMEKPYPLPLYGFVIPYAGRHDRDKFIEIHAKGRTMAQGYPPQVLGIYDPASHSFDYAEELPVVQLEGDTPLS